MPEDAICRKAVRPGACAALGERRYPAWAAGERLRNVERTMWPRTMWRVGSNPAVAALIAAMAGSAVAGSAFAQAARLPAFVQSGPFGDPLALVPGSSVASGRPARPLAPLTLGSRSGALDRSRIAAGRPAASRDPWEADDDEEDDEGAPRPARPGTLTRGFAKLPDPTPYLRNRSLGPHLTPDAEVAVTDRTSLGVLGQVDKPDTRLGVGTLSVPKTHTITTGSTGKPTSTVPTIGRNRDVGLGMSLEYRFGQ